MTEITRERAIAREKERVREGEAARKNVRHILCYKMYKTLHGMKHHTQSQSMFSFYLIKPYQPFNQTRTSTTHDQTTFSPSFRNYSISVSLDNANTEFKNCIKNVDSGYQNYGKNRGDKESCCKVVPNKTKYNMPGSYISC